MLFVGFMNFIDPGSLTQLVVAIMFAVAIFLSMTRIDKTNESIHVPTSRVVVFKKPVVRLKLVLGIVRMVRQRLNSGSRYIWFL